MQPPPSELESDAQEPLPTQPEKVVDESEPAAPTALVTVCGETAEEPLPTAIVDMERVLQDDGVAFAQPTVSVEVKGSLGEDDAARFAPIDEDERSEETRLRESREVVDETVMYATSGATSEPPAPEEVIQPTVPVLVSAPLEVPRTHVPRVESRPDEPSAPPVAPVDERRGVVVEGVVWGAALVLFGLLVGLIAALARR